ncbi:MAG TPA: hypothetical protein DD726_08250 [Phycisphaerales bacterium]|nr:hypothetical protein [Phycisphaerales bacterium]
MLADIKSKFAEEMSQEKANADQAATRFKAEAADELAKVRQQSQESIANEKVKAGEAIAKIKADTENTLAGFKAESLAKEKNYEERIAKVEAEANKSLADIKSKYAEEISQEKAKADNAAALLKSEYQAKEKNYQERILQIESESAKLLADIKSISAGEILRIRQETQEQIAKERTRANETAELTVRLKAESEETIAKITSESQAKSNAYEEHIAKIKAEAEKSASNTRTAFEEKISNLRIKVRDAIVREKTKINEKEKSYIEIIAAVRAEFEEKSKVHAEEMSKIKAELGIKMVKIKVEANDAVAKEQIKTRELEGELSKLKDGIAATKIERGQDTIKNKELAAKIENFAKKIAGYTKGRKFLKKSATTSSKQ